MRDGGPRRFGAEGVLTVATHIEGETTDACIADLSVGLGTGQLEAGAPARGERVARYGRRFEIGHELGPGARYVGRAAPAGAR